jgi:hypothetical protein
MPQFKLVKKFDYSWYGEFFQQVMLSDNSRELWMNSSDLGVGFRLNRSFSLELHNRFIRFRKPSNELEWRNLVYQTITWRETHNRWTLSIRNRVQQLSFIDHWDDTQKTPRWYDRVRFNASRRIDYYWAFSSNLELFYPLNIASRSGLDQYRIGASLSRRFNERGSIAWSYQFQQLLQRSRNNRYWVFGLQFVFEL